MGTLVCWQREGRLKLTAMDIAEDCLREITEVIYLMMEEMR